jgi:uncharacterized protein (TIGR00725 family)
MTQAVAVFGSSEPRDGEPAYRLAYRTGRALAAAGFTVATGGYGGVMEAACRGASDAGGHTIGVISDIFSERDPNPYLAETLGSRDLYERTRILIERSDGYVVLAGKAGTLAELAWVWALARAGSLPVRPVVALGAPWPDLLDLMERSDMMDPIAREMTERAADEDQAVAILERRLGRARA